MNSYGLSSRGSRATCAVSAFFASILTLSSVVWLFSDDEGGAAQQQIVQAPAPVLLSSAK